MPSSTQLLTFALTAGVIIAVPGPSVLFVVSRSLSYGRLIGVLTVVGNALGIYVQAIAVAVGIGALVAQSVEAFTVIKLAGAAYLIFLGVQALRHRRAFGAVVSSGGPSSLNGAVRDGFLVGLANPKGIIFFVSILPQFINRTSGHVPFQLLLLGTIFIVVALISDSAWALAAGTARAWFVRSPRRLELMSGLGGLAIIVIGFRLALSGRSS